MQELLSNQRDTGKPATQAEAVWVEKPIPEIRPPNFDVARKCVLYAPPGEPSVGRNKPGRDESVDECH